MSCRECQMGLPCSGGGQGGDGFLGLSNPEKRQNFFGDVTAGLAVGFGRAAARQNPTAEEPAAAAKGSTVKLPLIGEVPVGTAVAGGAAAALGLYLVLR